MGVEIDALNESPACLELDEKITFLNGRFAEIAGNPLFWNKFIRKYFWSNYKKSQAYQKWYLNFCRKAIERRVANSTTTNENNYIFIDRLLDKYCDGEIDQEGILEEVVTFVFAGSDTTSGSLYTEMN